MPAKVQCTAASICPKTRCVHRVPHVPEVQKGYRLPPPKHSKDAYSRKDAFPPEELKRYEIKVIYCTRPGFCDIGRKNPIECQCK